MLKLKTKKFQLVFDHMATESKKQLLRLKTLNKIKRECLKLRDMIQKYIDANHRDKVMLVTMPLCRDIITSILADMLDCRRDSVDHEEASKFFGSGKSIEGMWTRHTSTEELSCFVANFVLDELYEKRLVRK